MKLRKLLLGMIGASVLLGALASSASARTFSVTNQFLRSLFTAVIFRQPFFDVVCEIQLEGSLHRRSIAKVLGSLIGYITRAEILRCSQNRATILTETLPWHVRYLGFAGTLPDITRILVNVIGASFQVENGDLNCLGVTTAARPARVTFNRDIFSNAITTAEISGSVPSGPECGGFEGSITTARADVVVLNTTTRISVTLI